MPAMNLPPLYILRHGETEWNATGRLQGALNSPLTRKGAAQAARQAEILQGVDLEGFDVFTSPQGRAIETAAIALARRMPYLRSDDRLREIGLGQWSGRLLRDVSPPDGRAQAGHDPMAIYEQAPDAEGFAALEHRCTAFLTSLRAPAVLVTHSITSRMIRLLATGASPAQLEQIGCGQGVVYHVKDAVQIRLE